jgi:glycosyltransferase involved in cell wall biosynthesis
MTIGLLTTSYPRWDGDYAGSFVADRAAALAAEGHAVEVLAAAADDEAGATDDLGPPVAGTIAVSRLPASFGGHAPLFYGEGAPEALERGGAVAFLAAARFQAALASAARARAPRWDAIEAHWLVPSALAALAAAPALPRRAFAHSGDVALLERIPLGCALARRLARSGTDLRFVSEALRDRFAALAGARVGTVEALAAPAPLFPSRRGGADVALRRSLGLGGPTVLAVGRLVPIKGHEALLRACARLRARDPRGVGVAAAGVVILGDGPERTRLARLAAGMGVPLRLPGFVPRPEVARWLHAADVYVQPSVRLPSGRTEGAPLATAEARAVGIPVVVESDPARLAAALEIVIGV